MKIIKYKVKGFGEALHDAGILCPNAAILEANLPVAQRNAWGGEYTVEDDGRPDPSEAPTQLDVLEAQLTYTAMMTDTLLEV